MHRYRKLFEQYELLISQILVTAANFNTQGESERVRNTVETLLENGVIPIINENDATATAELELGDNDQLSAYAAYHFGADMLVILSDIDAYYDKDPHKHEDAVVLKRVTQIASEELEKEVTPHNSFATGGIVTKLKAADFLLKRERSMFLASGFDLSDVKSFLIEGEHRGGTLFTPETAQ
jgi:glutamate 5-kinase